MEDFLRSDSNALRSVHVIALALSGILRKATGNAVLVVEKHAQGNVVAGAAESPEQVSLLYTPCKTREDVRKTGLP